MSGSAIIVSDARIDESASQCFHEGDRWVCQ